MYKYALFLASLFIFSAAFAFSIDNYESDATVQPNGDLLVNERIFFTLEKQYNEGYRSIRPEDFGSLSNIVVHSIRLNGQDVDHHTQIYDGKGEIVWTETVAGENIVELSYTLKNRVELWDDYAKVCFEHYGANWAVPAAKFASTMALPEASRGKDMHFEVYSEKKGEAYIDDLTIVIEMNDVPSGNYIGGCYLFAKDSVTTTNTVEGSALEVLADEREAYGSESIVSPMDAFPCAPCCLPVFLILLAIAGYLAHKRPKIEELRETMIPPYKEFPIVVSTLMRGTYAEKEILAATILELINKGIIDIMELEKKGYTGQKIKRERTILFLKTTSKKLAPHEKTVIDLLFDEGKKKEVDLDALAKEFKHIQKKSEAKKTIIPKKMDEFVKQIKEILKKQKLYKHSESRKKNTQIITTVAMFLLLFGAFLGVPLIFGAIDLIPYLFAIGDYLYAAYIIISGIGALLAIAAIYYFYTLPKIPKDWEKKYAQWNTFFNAVKSSSLKEEPPSAALIWGEVLVYATALGIADKVNQHLSELDTLLATRIRKLESVRTSTYVLYASAWGVRNLSKYGQKSGPRSSGFSGGSSGGWSSGGGGFSGGSSGGGGFR